MLRKVYRSCGADTWRPLSHFPESQFHSIVLEMSCCEKNIEFYETDYFLNLSQVKSGMEETEILCWFSHSHNKNSHNSGSHLWLNELKYKNSSKVYLEKLKKKKKIL